MPKQMNTVLLACLLAWLLPAVGNATQTCHANIPATTAHLVDNHNGTVSDPKTGLMWKKCSEGLAWSSGTDGCGGSAASYTWKAALEQAQTVNNGGGFAGQVGWRVPNIKELASIVEGRCYAPAINLTVFPNTEPTYFWSSSPFVLDDRVLLVYFYDGSDGSNYKAYGAEVRLVRDGAP